MEIEHLEARFDTVQRLFQDIRGRIEQIYGSLDRLEQQAHEIQEAVRRIEALLAA